MKGKGSPKHVKMQLELWLRQLSAGPAFKDDSQGGTTIRFTEERLLFSADHSQTFRKNRGDFLPSRFNICNCLLKLIAGIMFNQYIINTILCFRTSNASVVLGS